MVNQQFSDRKTAHGERSPRRAEGPTGVEGGPSPHTRAEGEAAPIPDVRGAPGRSGDGIKHRLRFLQPISDALPPNRCWPTLSTLVGPGVKFQSGKLNYIHI